MILNTIIQSSSRNKAASKLEDKISRSFIKTISWRAVGTLDTIMICWLITGTLTIAFSVGVIELISKTVLYFFHERVWNTIKWGKQ